MARLIKISPTEKRTTLHDVEGIGVSARKKHTKVPPIGASNTQEFFAVRLLKGDGDGTEYYVEMSREEAVAVSRDLRVFLSQFVPSPHRSVIR